MKSAALFGIPVLLIGAGMAPARSYARPRDYRFSQSSPGQQKNDQQTNTAPAGDDAIDQDTSRPRTAAETYELRGDILMARKEFSDAKVLYIKVLDLQPKNSVVLNKLGIACQQLGDSEGAERYYKKAIRANKTIFERRE